MVSPIPTTSSDAEALRFVSGLSAELATGALELPAMPAVARRLSLALDDVRVTTDTLEAIVASEPGLAGRVVVLASSAALNPSADPIRNLNEALKRIGSGMLRMVTLAYALSHVRVATKNQQLGEELHAVWSRSMRVAALCQVVARRVGVNPESATFAGLLHGVGEICLLTRLSKHPALIGSDRYRAVICEWSGHVGRAMLENWGIDAQITDAIAGHTEWHREPHEPVNLTDVLTISALLSVYGQDPAAYETKIADLPILRRVLATPQDCREVIAAAQMQIEAMRAALGD